MRLTTSENTHTITPENTMMIAEGREYPKEKTNSSMNQTERER